MNKGIVAAIIGVIIIVVGVAGYFFISGSPNGILRTSKTENYPVIKACDILTKSIATSILGNNIIQPDQASSDIASVDLSVSNCTYTTKPDPTVSIPKTSGVSILARVARTASGADSNRQQFTTPPAGAQTVTGIGDAAYYAPQYRQLNVLKGNNWYIVTYYRDSITNASLDSDKQLATKLEYK